MKILVTGGAGFIGSYIVDILVEQGHRVYCVDDLSGGYLSNVNPKCKFTKLDLRDKKKTYNYIFKIKPEIVFPLAADEFRPELTPII